jgi:mono/diheme cytochrome c family protein
MSMRKSVAAAAALALALVTTARAETPGLGQKITESDIAAWDISILPDGTGLPPGSGTALKGAPIFAQKCAACHGENGKGGPNGAAMAGAPPPKAIDSPKTVGNFWGYSTTVFDFIRRAMPFQAPRTLSNDEVYALVAYILSLNKIIGETDVMNADTLAKVKMPNRDNFIIRFPDRI